MTVDIYPLGEHTREHTILYPSGVFNKAIVIPENVDAIHAPVGDIKAGHESIRLTEVALGMQRDCIKLNHLYGCNGNPHSNVAGGGYSLG